MAHKILMVESRRTRRIRKIIADMRAAKLQPCMRCGQTIDYEAPPDNPNAFNAGHKRAWATHPELREDPANYQQEHAHCNKWAGTLDGEANRLGMQTEEW